MRGTRPGPYRTYTSRPGISKTAKGFSVHVSHLKALRNQRKGFQMKISDEKKKELQFMASYTGAVSGAGAVGGIESAGIMACLIPVPYFYEKAADALKRRREGEK